MAHIVFFEIEKWEEPVFTAAFPQDTLTFHTDTIITLSPEDLTADILCVFIYSQVTKEVLSKFPNLKYIITRSVGFDHIDLAYCKEKGITVSNVPTYGVHTIVEHTFALLLAISRKIIPSVEQTRKGDFQLEGLSGTELFGKTLGVVGTGNIGKVVASLGVAFGMNVIASSHHEDEELKTQGVKYTTLENLLQQSDVLSFHVPSTPDTKHMLHVGNVALCKKGMILINTSRGAVIETQAILEGLDKGIFSGVGLDVLEGECDIREERQLVSTEFLKSCDLKTQLLNHMLLNRPEVIITPHNAFDSKESLHEILKTTISNIQSFQQGTPVNVITT